MFAALTRNDMADLEARWLPASHMHCAAGCQKVAGEWIDERLVCTDCRAPFVECTPEICGDHFQ